MTDRDNAAINLGQEPPLDPDDTQPRRPVQPSAGPFLNDTYYDDGLQAPPRILVWGAIALFILGIVGTVAGVLVFREVLTPGQQARVTSIMPFMEAFLPPRPGPGDTLPTAGPVDADAAQGLLTSPLDLGRDTAGTDGDESGTDAEAGAVTDPEPVDEAESLVPTATTTPAETPVPTEAPTVEIPPTEAPAQPEPESEPEPPVAQPEQPATSDESVVVAAAAPQQQWPLTARNFGFTHVQQTWNNCGPANITMALSYYGWQRDQAYAAQYLKPSREDKNVSPHELVNFVNTQTDVRAMARMGGDLDLLRILVANEFPVIIERSFTPEGYDWTGHYQTVVGYSDTAREFYVYDSFLGTGSNGAGITENYRALDENWKAFNRIFIVVYEPAREARLRQLLGDLANPLDAAAHAFDVAQQEARANPQDAFAWFNMGTSLTELGRYEEATVAFDQAFNLGVPWRMLWYQFGPFEAYYETGRHDDVLSYVETNLGNGGEWVEETYYWQGRVFAAQGRTNEARSAFRTALNRNRLFEDARRALDAIGG